MKTFNFFVAILVVLTFTNCSIDNYVSDQQPVPIVWNLTRVTGGVGGIDQTISSGKIKWTFNEQTHKLIVVNNNTDDSVVDFYDSGTYSFSVQSNGTTDILSINNVAFGTFEVVQNVLTINQSIDDGFVLTFTR